MAQPMLTVQQVATIFKVTPGTIRKWVKSGDFFRPMIIGNSHRWYQSDVDAQLAIFDAQRVSPQPQRRT